MAGHAGAFVRLSESTIGKLYDEDEYRAYTKLKAEEGLARHIPNCYGVKGEDSDSYMELEDVQVGYKQDNSSMFDIKIGYQTFQADGEEVPLPLLVSETCGEKTLWTPSCSPTITGTNSR